MQGFTVPMPSRAAVALLAAAAATTMGSARAADATFTDEATFLAATPGLVLESFEALAGSERALVPITTPGMTLVPGTASIGVQTGPNTPLDGFGAAATDGSHYVSVYAVNAAPGTLTFLLARPATAFGFTITDAGEAAGSIRLGTNAGHFAAGVDVYSFSTGQGNAQQYFVGLTQTQAFTQVTLTLDAFDEAYGVDAVYTNAVAVPEPGTAWSLAAGLAGLGALLRRRRPARD